MATSTIQVLVQRDEDGFTATVNGTTLRLADAKSIGNAVTSQIVREFGPPTDTGWQMARELRRADALRASQARERARTQMHHSNDVIARAHGRYCNCAPGLCPLSV